jgi:hypothetical protein
MVLRGGIDLSPGPHYYVVSLSRRSNGLFEAFRDNLIDIRNGGFPVLSAAAPVAAVEGQEKDEELHRALVTVDECFGSYQRQEPLPMVVVGDGEMQSLYASVTAYGEAVVGRVDGNHSATSPRDLGKIVWPVVKDAMSGQVERAMRDLETTRRQGSSIAGIEAVSRSILNSAGATLLVEGDYHVRGSFLDLGSTTALSRDVDVAEAMDDVVDVVVERVLAAGGHVVFMPGGSLASVERIVLLPARDGGQQP